MKTRIQGLIALMFLAASIQSISAQRVKVEAVNNDISYYLDLKAIATIFGDSRDLEEFERKINDYDAQISNLDLNSDGDVDYLRVIETSEDNTHLVVIQAVLDKDVYQDVATVVVERDRYRRTYVQIVGDPFIYGDNYIIEPYYYNTPYIVSWFWTPRYHSWYSPYRWGYYPRYYHYRRPLQIDIYLTHIHGCINFSNHYRYDDSWRSPSAYNMYNSIRRNDYSVRYPERTYTNRNAEYSNRYEMDKKRNSEYVRMSEKNGSDNGRYGSGSRTSSSDDVYGRSGRQGAENNSGNGSYNRNNGSTPAYGNRGSQNSNDSYRNRNSETITRPDSRNSSNTGSDYRKSTSSRNSEYNRQEVRKNESSQPRVSTRTSDDNSRSSRSSSNVERESSQRNSGSASGRGESSRSSGSESRSGGGRR